MKISIDLSNQDRIAELSIDSGGDLIIDCGEVGIDLGNPSIVLKDLKNLIAAHKAALEKIPSKK